MFELSVPVNAAHEMASLHGSVHVRVEHHRHESLLEFVREQLQFAQILRLVVQRQQGFDTADAHFGDLKFRILPLKITLRKS